MSYCAIITFENDVAKGQINFGNAWGGAARIWSVLFDTYLKKGQYDTWLNEKRMLDLWSLASSDKLPAYARALLASTFDYAVIRREHFEQFCNDLAEFDKRWPTKGNISNHLPAWRLAINGLPSRVTAIGFHGTSVSSNLFEGWNEETDESTWYDLRTGDRHFEVYDFVSEPDKEEISDTREMCLACEGSGLVPVFDGDIQVGADTCGRCHGAGYQ
jgi:hypothetical protein